MSKQTSVSEEIINNYLDLTIDELNNSVINYVKELRQLSEDKKAYVSGVRDACNQLNDCINAALEVIKRKREGSVA